MATNICASVGGNTGGILCDGKRRVPKKPIVGGKQFTSSEYATDELLIDAFKEAINLSNGDPDKLFPFPEILEVANNTEADTTGSLALGPVRRLRKGRPSYTYSVEIGHYQYKKLLAFDNKTVPVFTLDDSGQIWGYRAAAASNTPNTNVWKGEMALITVSGNGFEDGANAATGVATITISYLSVDDFEKRSDYALVPDLSSGDLVGLIDVMLSEPSAHVSNVYKIKASIPLPVLGGDLNIFDEYGAILAASTWTAGTGTNFATSLAITSVVVDNTLKCLTFTFDNTAYTALPGGTEILITPPSVAGLVADNMVGYELGTIIVVK
jgi:hypothetical protein